MKYLDRRRARQYLNDEFGLTLGASALAAFASKRRGPRYRMIGRWAMYSTAALRAWVHEETERPVVRDQRRSAGRRARRERST